MARLVIALLVVLMGAGYADAQSRPAAGVNREQNAPGSAGPKDDGVVQRGSQPNAAEVRPGNRDGDSPSASAGRMVPTSERRVLGLPVTAAIIIAGIVVALAVIAGALIPNARRRDRARGNGTYGPPS